MKMKIAKIREVIDRSDHCRLDLSGHTQDEFMRRNVPGLLGSIIEAMKALDIAPRCAVDRERRDSELVRGEAVIKRWRGLHGNSPSLLGAVSSRTFFQRGVTMRAWLVGAITEVAKSNTALREQGRHSR